MNHSATVPNHSEKNKSQRTTTLNLKGTKTDQASIIDQAFKIYIALNTDPGSMQLRCLGEKGRLFTQKLEKHPPWTSKKVWIKVWQSLHTSPEKYKFRHLSFAPDGTQVAKHWDGLKGRKNPV